MGEGAYTLPEEDGMRAAGDDHSIVCSFHLPHIR